MRFIPYEEYLCPPSALYNPETLHVLHNRPRLVVDRSQDFACEICHDDYTWQWHANSLGYRTSAELLSKHLILPLITFSDLAFASSEPLSQMPNDELEKVCAGRSQSSILLNHVCRQWIRTDGCIDGG